MHGSADPPTATPGGLPAELQAQLPGQLPVEVTSPTEGDEVFDRYARLVRTSLGVPVALVSLVSVNGQVFPGAVGLPMYWQQARCTGLSHSFCQHVVAHDAPLVITDARIDPRLADNLAIEDIGVIAYAGFPLHDPDGHAVGSLCAIDTAPRAWTQRELDVLADLAATAASELALRRSRLATTTATGAQRDATARLAEVTESMAVGYLSMDTDWRITYVNTEAVHALGRPREELVGGIIWDLFPATVGTDFEAGYRRAATTGQVVTFDAYYPEPLNAWYEVRATPETTGVALYFVNITERRRAAAASELASARVSALGRIALSLTDAEDINDLVATMAEQGLTALGADGGSVAVFDPEDPQMLRSYITANFGEDTRADFGLLPLDVQLPVAAAARTGQAVLLGDQAACAAMSEHVLAANTATGCQAWASMPLLAGGQVLGVLTAGWAAAQSFPAEQVELLETFAAQCAQALQRLQAREAERSAAHEARTSASRQAALVAIARALSAAEDEREVLRVLEGQGAALLAADGSGLALREPDGQYVRTLASDSFDADLRADVQRVPADFPMPIIHAAATGATHLFGDRASTVAAFPGAEALYTAAGVQASACLPLRGSTGLLGSISLAFAGQRAFTTEEQDLLEAFAALTAQALERIAAHTAEQAALVEVAGIAETLQRSMLTAPPEPDHLQVVVRYTAAAEAAEVGGDWYDAFITADGQTTLAIGDVTGHDMRAAAVMGQLRNLLRGIGFTLGEPPARVLAAVDRAAAGLGIETVATAILAQVEQDEAHRAAGTRLLRWSNAGHPPPLLIEADGAVRYLDEAPDLVLGWDPSVERFDHEVVLAPGATVLLYTDGLIERRRTSLQDGLDWLAKAAGQLAHASVDELCDGLLAQVEGHLDDDVALVALRAHPEDAPRPPEAGPSRVPAGLPKAQESAARSE